MVAKSNGASKRIIFCMVVSAMCYVALYGNTNQLDYLEGMRGLKSKLGRRTSDEQMELESTTTCRIMHSRSLAAPVSPRVAREMITDMTKFAATLENCPMFMHAYREIEPYTFWAPWQPEDTVTKWSKNMTCQSELFCDEMFPLEENKIIARKIYEHQHPQDCGSASFLIVSGEWGGGFGSAIHVKARILLHAIRAGRVLVDADDNRWRFTSPESCARADMGCYFAPMTDCVLPTGWRDQAEVFKSWNSTAKFLVAPSSTGTAEAPVHQISNLGFMTKPDMWWFTHATVYIVRPNLRTLNVACFAWRCISRGQKHPERPFASIFIRSGDKFKEAVLHKTHEYFNMLWFQSHAMKEPIRTVYVGSDNALLLNDVLQDYGSDWPLLWMGHFRGAGGSHAETEYSIGLTPLIELRSLVTLADIYISAAADLLVGTLSSNQCRMMDELRKVAGKARMPYLTPEVALDFGMYG